MNASPDQAPPPGPPRAALRVAFLTLFLDLVGFSIIFPLFPSMLAHYQATEGDTGLFGWVHGALVGISGAAGAPNADWGVIVLFGGVLGSLYSLLQFVCAPLFGALSDRVGRRPVVLLSLLGLAISYAMWFFAGNFAVLVAARVLGGVMSANISTVSAIVADVTTPQTRSRGMALIGIAFGLGFVLGPALGGVASLIDLTAGAPPTGAAWALNPYSVPALIAMLLTLGNLVQAFALLPETLRPGARSATPRTVNPLRLFQTESYPGVTRVNVAYFLFIFAFSGMEFSLTFLAVDRLGFTPRENALLFLFIGVVLAVTQGSYVRRFSERIGPRRMAFHGLAMLAPGLVIVGLAGAWRSVPALYLGLLLLALGAAQATPCLTALASLYAPAHDQGRILGVFRSLGALARALGPLTACLVYWQVGGSATYYLGAAAIVVPLWIATRLPDPPAGHPDPPAAR